MSRTSFYRWRQVAELYGLETLRPKDRRRPPDAGDDADPRRKALLTAAVTTPTIGRRQYADRLATRDELRIAIITWIERTYHRRRRQPALGRLTPSSTRPP